MTNAKLLLECIYENAEMYHQCDDEGNYDFTQMGWTASDAMDVYELKTTAEGLSIIEMLLTGKLSYEEASSMAYEIDETPEQAKNGELVYDLQYGHGEYFDSGQIYRLEDGSYFVWRSSLRPQNRAERRISAEEYEAWENYVEEIFEGQSRYNFNSMPYFDRFVEGEGL
ncbi:hypothetical protein ACN2XU_22775 [Primorskyibacter sp. 2E107]|uniref:hypothetical protein n=1 Tax=Primorskyibacter sp. 2E107 TaxID=3403458 RepID=UPI003AF792C7